MDWSTIIQTIEKAVQENLDTIVLMLIVVGSLSAINIVLGTIIGTFTFCYTLNLFALTLQLTKDITISTDFISTVEVFTILIVWAIDIAKDVIAKIKSMKELKYVKYEDVQINVNNQSEVG